MGGDGDIRFENEKHSECGIHAPRDAEKKESNDNIYIVIFTLASFP